MEEGRQRFCDRDTVWETLLIFVQVFKQVPLGVLSIGNITAPAGSRHESNFVYGDYRVPIHKVGLVFLSLQDI
jgi:hypothetical protein